MKVCSKEHLNDILNKEVREKTINHELNEVLSQMEIKFGEFLFELVPSLGRLFTLVNNQASSSSFTQFRQKQCGCGVVAQNRAAGEDAIVPNGDRFAVSHCH